VIICKALKRGMPVFIKVYSCRVKAITIANSSPLINGSLPRFNYKVINRQIYYTELIIFCKGKMGSELFFLLERKPEKNNSDPIFLLMVAIFAFSIIINL